MNRTASGVAAPVLAGMLLLWPAWVNGYPLLFADSGTYAGQVAEGVLGWDRPPFYGLFVAALSWRISLWPVIAAQAVATAAVLAAVVAAVAPGAGASGSGPSAGRWRLPAVAALLAGATALPWCVARIMPDVATGLVVLTVGLLAGAPAELSRRSRAVLAVAATALIVLHLSHLPLALALAGAGLLWARPGRRAVGWALAPVVVAGLLIGAVNLVGHGRAGVAPFGGVFLLARLIEDGPARAELARACPAAGWSLCAEREALPATADAILWSAASPLQAAERRAATPFAFADEAAAIVAATWRAAPRAVASAMARDFGRQLGRFATGDGLGAWPAEVAPHIARDFPPAEQAAYAAAAQTRGALAVPGWLEALHRVAALAGIAACAALAPWRGAAPPARALAVVVLVALPVNAAVTGALSGPHDRYQSRVMWVPLAVAAAALPLRVPGRRPVAACA